MAVKTVEGSKDDISAPGQCIAALDLLTGLPDSKKASHLEDGAGHYGIFAGKSWRNNIRPLVLDFIDANNGQPEPKTPEPQKSKPQKPVSQKSAPKKTDKPEVDAASRAVRRLWPLVPLGWANGLHPPAPSAWRRGSSQP